MHPIDLSRIRTIPLRTRKNKIAFEHFARPPQSGRPFVDFLTSLPKILAGEDFREVEEAIVMAHRTGVQWWECLEPAFLAGTTVLNLRILN